MAQLTDAERAVLTMTGELFNAIAALGDHHPSDMDEHIRDIHSIQNRVMARVAVRAAPNFFGGRSARRAD